MYGYSHLQQGYKGTGGVPHNNTPTIPTIDCGPLMKPHQEYIASKIYEDMVNRKNIVSNHVTNEMAKNTFHNELFSTALQLSSDYIEYLVGAKQLDLNIAIATAVPVVNDSLINSYISKAPNLASHCTEIEKGRYHQSNMQLNSMKKNIRDYLTRGGNMYPQTQYAPPPAYPQQPYQQPVGFPQGMPPQGYYPQPQPGQMPPHMQQQMVQQQPSLMQRVLSRGTPVQPQGFQPQYPQQQPHMHPAYQQQQQMMQQQMYQQQQMMQPQFQQQQFGGWGGQPVVQTPPNPWGGQPQQFASNGQAHYAQPQPQRDKTMPHVSNFDFKLKQPSSAEQQPAPQVNNIPFDPNGYQRQVQQNVVNNAGFNSEITEYENKVRAYAKAVGLPHDIASIEMLEQVISAQYPHNGIIDTKRPYKVRIGESTAPLIPPSRQEVQHLIKKMTDEELRVMASKSKGKMVQDENGRYLWQSDRKNPETVVNRPDMFHPNVGVEEQPKPYPFAKVNTNGKMFIDSSDFEKIPKDKRNGWSYISCDAFRECHYFLNDNGEIIDAVASFARSPQTEKVIVKYEDHDNRRYFNAMLESDVGNTVDAVKSSEVFAKAQVQLKVKELLEQLESEAGVIGDGDETTIITDQTVELNEVVQGEYHQDNYLVKANLAAQNELSDKVIMGDNISYRYLHAHQSPIMYIGEDAKTIRQIEKCKTYEDLVEFITELEQNDGLLPLATELNTKATYYINNILLAVFGIGRDTFYMESFVTDILDVVEAMEERGLGEEFDKYAEIMKKTVLHFYDKNSNVFKGILEFPDDDIDRVHTGLVRDVTTLPIRSKDVFLPSDNKRAIVTETSYPALHKLITKTLEYVHPRVSEVVFCTIDNRQMYVYKTAKPGVYAIIQNSIVVDSRSSFA